MIYLTFIGNHDKIIPDSKEYGAVISIFQNYSDKIEKVFLFVTPDKKFDKISYKSIAEENKNEIVKIKKSVKVELIELDFLNPIDYDLVYPIMFDKI